MTKTLPVLLLLLSTLYSLLYALTANAIVIRHDKDDKLYQQLAEPYEASVVYLGICVGTVIDRHWVLTAAHCANPVTQLPIYITHLGKQYPVAQIIAYPNPKRDFAHDIALLRLSWPLKNAKPALLYNKTDQLGDELGKVVTFVGNGKFGDGLSGEQVFDDTLRAATNTVKTVEPNLLTFNFDKPPSATELEGVSGIQDSGGPAFFEQDGKRYIVGVGCCQDPVISPAGVELHGGYNSTEYYVRVQSHRDWLIQQMADAPVAPVIKHPILDALAQGNVTLAKQQLKQRLKQDHGQWSKDPSLVTAILLNILYHDHSDIKGDIAELILAQFLAQLPAIKQHKINGLPLAAYALKQNNGAFFTLLVNAGADLSYRGFKGQDYLSLLSWQYLGSDYGALVDLLLAKGFDINAQDKRGDGAIHLAGFIADADRIRLLVAKGANINLRDNNGMTILMDMVRRGNIKLLKLLIKLGADSGIRNKKGQTAWDMAKALNHNEAMAVLVQGVAG